LILRVVRRNDKRKHERNKGTPAGKVDAVLAIGGSKFSQIEEEKREKARSFIGGWNGHLRRGWLAQPRRLTLLQCSVLLLREGG
jgi:hypothetical protein